MYNIAEIEKMVRGGQKEDKTNPRNRKRAQREDRTDL